MPSPLLAAAFALGAAAAPVSASPHDNATLCLDTLGVNRPATCRSFSASRIDSTADICQCLGSTATVIAPYCGPGEQPQADSGDYDRARRAASLKDGSLIGKTYKGRSFCVARPVGGR